ncbi:MAG: hypothetical protein ABIK80_05405, partial [candidate division WOR-3 bacterium]
DKENSKKGSLKDIRFKIEEKIKEEKIEEKIKEEKIEEKIKEEKKITKLAKELLRIISINLTEDIITLTYVGGDKGKRGEEDDRILQLWNRFYKLFYKNLSNGPAICILHGYEEEEVGPFFVAEYDPILKSYKIMEKYKPRKERKEKKEEEKEEREGSKNQNTST